MSRKAMPLDPLGSAAFVFSVASCIGALGGEVTGISSERLLVGAFSGATLSAARQNARSESARVSSQPRGESSEETLVTSPPTAHLRVENIAPLAPSELAAKVWAGCLRS